MNQSDAGIPINTWSGVCTEENYSGRGGDGKITDPSEKPVLFGLCIWVDVKATRPFSRLSGPGTTGDMQHVGTREPCGAPIASTVANGGTGGECHHR